MTINLTIPVTPRTKKNHTQRTRSGKQIQSKAYRQFEDDCIWLIPGALKNLHITQPCNVKCLFYLDRDYISPDSKIKIDLTGLLQAIDDVLVKAGVLADDCARILKGHDGSRVFVDKARPRIEIEINTENREEEK
jgi:Holliday junction resolvase RusA-like endonuclease